jgi:hypothetical protein
MTDHPDPFVHWRNRRRHSYIAHWSLVALTFLMLVAEVVKPGTVQGLSPMLTLAYSTFVLIVLAYIANCAVEKWIEEKFK